MTRIFLILFLIFSLASLGQSDLDKYKIVVSDNSYYPFYIFTTKPQGTWFPGTDKVVLKYPKRTDTVEYYNASGESYKDTLSTSFFSLDRIIDTICYSNIYSFINSEIKVFYNNKKLKIDRITVKVLYPDRTFHNTNFKSNKISFDQTTISQLEKKTENAYLVIGTIWVYDPKGKRHEISDEVGWKLKNCL